MAEPEDNQWPPTPPDVDGNAIELELPEIAVSANSMLYKIQGRPDVVYKSRAEPREYELHKAAGDCAIPLRGRVLMKFPHMDGIDFRGFLMDLVTPIIAPDGPAPPPALVVPLSGRRELVDQMVSVVQRLHARGIVHGDLKLENMLVDGQGRVRLCDFAEGRYVNEDEEVWEGITTWHYESPGRLLRGERMERDPPPPTVEDDLYGLGLSIWALYTGKIPNGDWAGDDLGLKERQRKGETVDVVEVDDPDTREVIKGLLRRGGALV
jgi:serine/threonine protein kinase